VKAGGRTRVVHVVRRLAAGYDAAKTTLNNMRHWAAADLLGPNAANSPAVRRILRSRGRYEVANNPYVAGVVGTLVNSVIGTGPSLQMQTGDDDFNRRVEMEWTAWMRATRLVEKMRTLEAALAGSGESFALLIDNPLLPTPARLDVRLIEADQVADPSLAGVWDPQVVDGIRFDDAGNPVAYSILRNHPGELLNVNAFEADWVPAANVIHLFRADRPGQVRGIPEITPALETIAIHRRFILAVAQAAENAANLSGYVKSSAPPSDDPDDSEGIKAGEELEIERGTFAFLPDGYDLGQLKAEHPAITYDAYDRALVRAIFRCLGVPLNIASGDSSQHNFASAKLDTLIYARCVEVRQNRQNETVLDRLFAAWVAEMALIEPAYQREDLRHQWAWNGIGSVDEAKAANAEGTQLANGTLTFVEAYARRGRDCETEMTAQARALGISLDEYRALLRAKLYGSPGPAASPVPADEDEGDR